MRELIQLTQPAVEPVALVDAFVQLGLGTPSDSTLNAQLTQQVAGLLMAARIYCENVTRTSFITRTYQFNMDDWPGYDGRYHHGFMEFYLPQCPLQSIASFQYVDVNGNVQQLPQDISYGNGNNNVYAYQLDQGSDTRPARLLPAWARPWPPTRRVANAVQVQFKSGYGGPVSASMGGGSPILTGPVFNPGDAGQAVSVPGAGTAGAALATTILSVDQNGQATLAASAAAAVALAANNVWVGQQVPQNILLAIKFMTQVFYEQGAISDLPVPSIVDNLLSHYKNRVS